MATAIVSISISLDMTQEINRVASLYDFKPSWMRPSACLLARWGFYWDGSRHDSLVCVHCRQVLDRTILEDNPLERHRRKTPHCSMFAGNEIQPYLQQILLKYKNQNSEIMIYDSTDSIRSREQHLVYRNKPDTSPKIQNLLETFRICFDRATQHGVFETSVTLPPPILNRLDPDYRLLQVEATRLTTYHDWPIDVKIVPERFAKAGFFYTGTIDRVQCAFCKNFLKSWADTDDPEEEHRKHFPECPFVLGTAADIESVDGDESRTVQSVADSHFTGFNLRRDKENSANIYPPPIVNLCFRPARRVPRCNLPKHPDFTDETKRMQSFVNKLIPKGQNINVLANAGFFHFGPLDSSKCFYCNGTLTNWEPSDDPWVAHAKWFPKCGFLRSRRDPGYIKVIQDKFRSTQLAIENMTTSRSGEDEESTVETAEGGATEQNASSVAVTVGEGAAMGDTAVSSPSSSIKANKKKNKKKRNKEKKKEEETNQGTERNVSTADPGAEGELNSETRAVFDEHRALHEAKTCKVCMDEDVNVVFLPCGHLACCNTCAPSLPHCPICRGLIRGTVRVFLS